RRFENEKPAGGGMAEPSLGVRSQSIGCFGGAPRRRNPAGDPEVGSRFPLYGIGGGYGFGAAPAYPNQEHGPRGTLSGLRVPLDRFHRGTQNGPHPAPHREDGRAGSHVRPHRP